MNMYSNRSYSKSIQTNTAVFKWTLDGSRRQVEANSMGLSYKENASYSLLGDAFPTYNSLGKEIADYDSSDMQTLNNSTSRYFTETIDFTGTVDISDVNEKADKSTLRKSFLSLLEMLEKARFKSKFSDSDLYKELTASNNTSFDSSTSALKLTSSAQPQLWKQKEVNSYFMEEKETTAFSTTGTVVTADGRSISFDVTMEMSRSFSESYEFSQLSEYTQILTDPLIINLDSNPTSISDKTFLFDIDADGVKDEISQLSSGSGYLALDKNGDGIINNGSELFGPSTGNGFGELSSLDSDKNGWIDEADQIYQKLKVWTKDENGKDVLLSLKDADVGAIYLGSTKTSFALTDDSNNLKGQIQRTGMYLKENGGTGTIQEVDF